MVPLTAEKAHLNCFNPRTFMNKGKMASTNEILNCEITTDVFARVEDFANPAISTTPPVPWIGPLKPQGAPANQRFPPFPTLQNRAFQVRIAQNHLWFNLKPLR